MANNSSDRVKVAKHKPTEFHKCVYALVFIGLFQDIADTILNTIQGKKLDQECFDLENFLFENVCIPSFTIGRFIAMKIPDDFKITANGVSDPKERGGMGTISNDHTKTLVVVKEKLPSPMIGAKFLILYFGVLELVNDQGTFEADINGQECPFFFAFWQRMSRACLGRCTCCSGIDCCGQECCSHQMASGIYQSPLWI